MNSIKKQLRNIRSALKKLGPLKLTAIIFGILILFIIIVEKPGSTSSTKIAESQPFIFPRLTIEKITHVTITAPGEDSPTIELRREEDEWMIGDASAKPELSKEFVDSILDLKKEEVVSKNPEKQSNYAVDSETGSHIQIWKNTSELADFYVGNMSGAKAQYIRIGDTVEVLQVNPPLAKFLELQKEEWQVSESATD